MNRKQLNEIARDEIWRWKDLPSGLVLKTHRQGNAENYMNHFLHDPFPHRQYQPKTLRQRIEGVGR